MLEREEKETRLPHGQMTVAGNVSEDDPHAPEAAARVILENPAALPELGCCASEGAPLAQWGAAPKNEPPTAAVEESPEGGAETAEGAPQKEETSPEKTTPVGGDTEGEAEKTTPVGGDTECLKASPVPTDIPDEVEDIGVPVASPEGKRKNRKKLVTLLVTAGVILLALAAVLIIRAVINRQPPELSEIRDRAELLITNSREVNEIFFGEGLPSYPRVMQPVYTIKKFKVTYGGKEYNRSYMTFTDKDGKSILKYQYCLAAGKDTDGDGTPDQYEYPDLEKGGFLTVEYVNDYRYAELFLEKKEGAFYEGERMAEDGETTEKFWLVRLEDYVEPFYYTEEDELYYDYVTEECEYQMIDQIKALAETVYSPEYLASLYESMFTGITVSDRDSGTLLARYAEIERDGFLYLMKSNRYEAINVKRVYDFSTMKMVKPSNRNHVTLEIETYLEGEEDERITVRVGLALVDGQWFLDSPTY